MYTRFPCPPAYSFAGRYPQSTPSQQAQVSTQYTPQDLISAPQSKSYSFATAAKSSSISRARKAPPGVGDYNIDTQAISRLSPRGHVFSIADRKQSSRSRQPGPGEYLGADFVPTQRSYSLGGRDLPLQSKGSVGPQSYNTSIQASRANVHKATFSTASRFHSKQDHSSGPGSYNIQRASQHASHFQSAPRLSVPGSYPPKIKDSPGPGDYSAQQQHQGKRYSFAAGSKPALSRRQTEKVTPGPGHYQPPSEEVRGGLIGKEHCSKSRVNLGLPQYNEDYFWGQKLPPGKVRGFQYHQPVGKSNASQTPGPCSYQLLRPSSAPKGTIGKAGLTLGRPNKSISPGPQKYVIPSSFGSKKQLAATMKRPKKETLKRPSPGPGQYEWRKPIVEGSKWSIGKGDRELKKEWLPGPGHYNIPPFIAEEPAFVFMTNKGKTTKP